MRPHDPETDFGMIPERLDMGRLTLECYANNLAECRGGNERKEWPTKEGKGGRAGDAIGAKENPKGIPWGLVNGLD
jgi:hypothetical protein